MNLGACNKKLFYVLEVEEETQLQGEHPNCSVFLIFM